MSDAPGLKRILANVGGPHKGQENYQLVYLASEVEARDGEIVSDVEKVSILAFGGQETPKTSLGGIYRISQRLLGRLT